MLVGKLTTEVPCGSMLVSVLFIIHINNDMRIHCVFQPNVLDTKTAGPSRLRGGNRLLKTDIFGDCSKIYGEIRLAGGRDSM